MAAATVDDHPGGPGAQLRRSRPPCPRPSVPGSAPRWSRPGQTPSRPAGCRRSRTRLGGTGGGDRAARQPRVRGLRHEPRDEAGAPAPQVAPGDRGGARRVAAGRVRPASLIASAEVARPGFLNLRVTDDAFASAGRRDPRGARRLGPDPGREPAPRQRGVRVRQPDRAAHRGQRAGRLRRRPAVPGARGGRPGGHARVLLQRLGDADRAPRRVGGGRPARRARARGRVQGRLRRGPREGAAGRRLGAGVGTGRGRAGHRRPLGRDARAGDDRGVPRCAWASSSTSGRARPRCTTRAGSRGPSTACARPATSTSRTAPSGSGPRPSATTRTV